MDGPIDYLSGIHTFADPLKEIQDQVAFKAGLAEKQAQTQQAGAQVAEIVNKLSRQQMFQKDLTGVQGNPTPTNVSALMMKYPEFEQNIKGAWDTKDKAQRDADLTSIGQIYTPALSGDWGTALKSAQQRYDADKAAGQATPDDDQFMQTIGAAAQGDKQAQKSVLTSLGFHAAAAAGADHFATVYGALKGGYTLGAGDVRYDENGNPVAHSPFIKGDDNKLYSWDSVMGQDGSGASSAGGAGSPVVAGKGVSPAAASVASELQSSGLPPAVVAGFMGNFHVEGGWDGAQGDGGSASGIAQWHSDRASNFERVIGKPVTEATPAEQARFVAWEMQNPQAAGMTIKQRDAILAAKDPAQAASLIDQYYERSNGKDRNVRMSAATAFAGGGTDASGAPGASGPKPLFPNTPKFKTLSPAEVKQRGLDPSQQYQMNTETGQLTGLGKAGVTGVQPPGNPDLAGPDYIQSLQKTNPSLAAQVQGVLDTRLAYPPATARSPQAQQLRAAVLQAFPGYDEQAYARRKTTVQQYTPGHAGPGQSMLSAATIINHMYDMAQAARELPDHYTKLQNWISSTAADAVNAPWLIKYNEGRKFVSSELPKFLNGKAPTEGEQRDHYSSYDPSKGKTGILTALGTDIDYLFGRFQPLIQAYKDNTGKDLNLDNYAPGQATRAKVTALEYFRENGALPTVVTSPKQAQKLPHGAVFVTPDGRVLRRH